LVPFEEINEGLFEHVDDIVFDECYLKWLLSSPEERITQEKEMDERLVNLMSIYNAFVV
jgi:hypothetical protein